MRKTVIVLFLAITLILLSGCYKDRNELFDIPIVSGTYSYIEENDILFLDKEITNFSITFIDTDSTTKELDNYDTNVFGDYSFNEIKLYNVLIEIEFDNIKQDCDVDFLGAANPQRPNAYRLFVTIPNLSDQQEDFHMIIDFDMDESNKKGLNKIYVQIVDEINSASNKMDTTFYIDYIGNGQ